MGNDGLSSKQVGSQASRRVTRQLAWIKPVCISINAVPALKGLIESFYSIMRISYSYLGNPYFIMLSFNVNLLRAFWFIKMACHIEVVFHSNQKFV